MTKRSEEVDDAKSEAQCWRAVAGTAKRGEEVDYDDFWREAARKSFDDTVHLLRSTMDKFAKTKDFLDGGVPWNSLSNDEKDRWTLCVSCIYGMPKMNDEFDQFSEAEKDFHNSDVVQWFLKRCME